MKNEPMNAEKKKRDLYLRQKELLNTFLEHGAISRAQYDKSLGDLTVKMGMETLIPLPCGYSADTPLPMYCTKTDRRGQKNTTAIHFYSKIVACNS